MFCFLRKTARFICLGISSFILADSLQDKLEQLTLEQKIGQIFISFVETEELDQETELFLNETKLGNIIYFEWSNGLHNPLQVRNLSLQLTKKITEVTNNTPFIAVDQEGGRVQRYKPSFDGCDPKFTDWPSQMAIGQTQDPQLAYLVSKAIAEELSFSGANVNLAPVADVNDNPRNPVIGTRAYGSDPHQVSLFVKHALKGLKDAKIIGAVKHAPGHGNTHMDSHFSLPEVTKNLSELQKIEFVPFKDNVKDISILMTAHVLMPEIDSQNCCTQSYKILNEIVRKDWQFDGVIMSDSLTMKGVCTQQDTFEEALQCLQNTVKKSFLAGCDCLLLGRFEFGGYTVSKEKNREMIRKTLAFFKDQVIKGEISQKRLDQSVLRILKVKNSVSDFKERQQEPNWQMHRQLSQLVADKSLIQSPSNKKHSFKDFVLVVPVEAKAKFEKINAEMDISNQIIYYTNKDLISLKKKLDEEKRFCFFSYNVHLFPQQKELLSELSRQKDNCVFVSLGNPLDLEDIDEQKHLKVFAYSPCFYTLQSVLKVLNESEKK